jgi:hypothetical protein
MCLQAENNLSTSQDVIGAYFNKLIFSGAMSSGESTVHHIHYIPERHW